MIGLLERENTMISLVEVSLREKKKGKEDSKERTGEACNNNHEQSCATRRFVIVDLGDRSRRSWRRWSHFTPEQTCLLCSSQHWASPLSCSQSQTRQLINANVWHGSSLSGVMSLMTTSVKFNAWRFQSKGEQDILSILTRSTRVWTNLLELRHDQTCHRVKEIDGILEHCLDQIGSREWPGKEATWDRIDLLCCWDDSCVRTPSFVFHSAESPKQQKSMEKFLCWSERKWRFLQIFLAIDDKVIITRNSFVLLPERSWNSSVWLKRQLKMPNWTFSSCFYSKRKRCPTVGRHDSSYSI